MNRTSVLIGGNCNRMAFGFDYNAASDTFTPGTTAGSPPQGNNAKCGFACHRAAKANDYVFTEYGKRRTARKHVR